MSLLFLSLFVPVSVTAFCSAGVALHPARTQLPPLQVAQLPSSDPVYAALSLVIKDASTCEALLKVVDSERRREVREGQLLAEKKFSDAEKKFSEGQLLAELDKQKLQAEFEKERNDLSRALAKARYATAVANAEMLRARGKYGVCGYIEHMEVSYRMGLFIRSQTAPKEKIALWAAFVMDVDNKAVVAKMVECGGVKDEAGIPDAIDGIYRRLNSYRDARSEEGEPIMPYASDVLEDGEIGLIKALANFSEVPMLEDILDEPAGQ